MCFINVDVNRCEGQHNGTQDSDVQYMLNAKNQI